MKLSKLGQLPVNKYFGEKMYGGGTEFDLMKRQREIQKSQMNLPLTPTASADLSFEEAFIDELGKISGWLSSTYSGPTTEEIKSDPERSALRMAAWHRAFGQKEPLGTAGGTIGVKIPETKEEMRSFAKKPLIPGKPKVNV